MKEKKTGAKFTILFNPSDPVHQKAADILNRQPQRGKAHYVAQAIVYYEKFNGAAVSQNLIRVDDKHIETVVDRILRDRNMSGEFAVPVSVPVGQVEKLADKPLINMNDMSFDDVMESLGEEGLDSVANALDMFRRK